MSLLRIYSESDAKQYQEISDYAAIQGALQPAGLQFERWHANQHIGLDATTEQILETYHGQVSNLMKQCGYVTADVIAVNSNTPNHQEIRNKFLNEHTHSEDEARFFVDGAGLFYIHTSGHVFALLCERGDFLRIPAGTKHWFDMGPKPFLKCIRTFTTPEGWVADFTGSDIASRFPRFEAIVPVLA